MTSESIFTELELMQARIRFVPDGWAFSNIGNVFNICNNLRKPINEDERGKNLGEFPYYGPTKIQGYIGTYEQDGSYALIGEDGDHFLKFETQSMTQLVDGKCTVNNHAHILEGTKRATREWFYYYFMHRDIFSFLSRQGAGRYKLNKASLEKIPLLVPPLPEQKKIAQILSTWDKAITTTEQLLANSQQQKKALMQQLLTGKKRLKGFSGEWKTVKLGRITEKVGSGITPTGGSSVYTSSGIPFIRSQNVLWGKLDFSDIAYINDSQHKKMSGSSVLPNDVLLNITGASIGRCCTVPGKLKTSNVNQHVCIIRPKKGIGSDYLKFFLLSHYGQKQIEQFQAGGNRQGLNFEQIKSFKIHIPELEEQQKIAAVLSAADREIEVLQQKLEGLKQEKKALMQQLLTGKLRVKV